MTTTQALNDDRTDEQKWTHDTLIGGRDRLLSGWGRASRSSYAYWACRREDVGAVTDWVNARGDISRVCCYSGDKFRHMEQDDGETTWSDHVHIYVVGDNHPALR